MLAGMTTVGQVLPRATVGAAPEPDVKTGHLPVVRAVQAIDDHRIILSPVSPIAQRVKTTINFRHSPVTPLDDDSIARVMPRVHPQICVSFCMLY